MLLPQTRARAILRPVGHLPLRGILARIAQRQPLSEPLSSLEFRLGGPSASRRPQATSSIWRSRGARRNDIGALRGKEGSPRSTQALPTVVRERPQVARQRRRTERKADESWNSAAKFQVRQPAACAKPLIYWCRLRESNPRPTAYKAMDCQDISTFIPSFGRRSRAVTCVGLGIVSERGSPPQSRFVGATNNRGVDGQIGILKVSPAGDRIPHLGAKRSGID
jgi:hypothetical protein